MARRRSGAPHRGQALPRAMADGCPTGRPAPPALGAPAASPGKTAEIIVGGGRRGSHVQKRQTSVANSCADCTDEATTYLTVGTGTATRGPETLRNRRWSSPRVVQSEQVGRVELGAMLRPWSDGSLRNSPGAGRKCESGRSQGASHPQFSRRGAKIVPRGELLAARRYRASGQKGSRSTAGQIVPDASCASRAGGSGFGKKEVRHLLR